MVDIALDPNMYYRTMSTVRTLYKAAELGFEYVELSPNADFHFWHHRPAADDAFVADLNKAQKDTGVKVRTEGLAVPAGNGWPSCHTPPRETPSGTSRK